MGLLGKGFKRFQNNTFSIERESTVVDTLTGGVSSKTFTAIRSGIQCGFYEGSSADVFISDKFKAETDGVVCVDAPLLSGITLSESDRITLDNSKAYSVVNYDDINNMGDTVVIALKEVK